MARQGFDRVVSERLAESSIVWSGGESSRARCPARRWRR